MNPVTTQDRQQESVGELLNSLGAKLAARRVLVVEDDESSQEFYQQLFAIVYPNEFRCEIVSSGVQALIALETRPFDAVILDRSLPGGIDGLAVLRHMRAEPTMTQLPVLVVTANDDSADELAAREAGADDFLGKPTSPDELVRRLRALLA